MRKVQSQVIKFKQELYDMSEPTEVRESNIDQPRVNEIAQKFLADLDGERKALGDKFPLCALLIDEAFDRVYTTGRIPGKEFYADVYKQKPIKITQKVFVPIKQYPKFNFTGKILGPKGNSLRRLQEETQCRIVIKGRNSIRDRIKEEEMRSSSDPRHAHLNKDLFVEISTVATPAESYARISCALAEIRRYIVPDKNDEVSHEQLGELMEIDPKLATPYNKSIYERKISGSGSGSKLFNLIKQRASHSAEQEAEHDEQEEHEDETSGYEKHIRKRPIPTAYEYVKVQSQVIKFKQELYDMSEPTEVRESNIDQPRVNEIAQKFLADLDGERKALGDKFPLCALLIDEAFDRVYTTGRIPGKEFYADVYKQKPIKITQKVFVPIKQYPKFNFTGKILGPKGNSLRRLQEETQCRIVIKGRNSIRDRIKEEEMRSSSDPRHAHLNKDLFVEISTVATPAESYARISCALAEIRRYIVPDKNDEVSHEQLSELMEIDPKLATPYNKSIYERKISGSGSGSKLFNLIKQRASHSAEQEAEHDEQEEHEDETSGYEKHIRKRPIPTAHEYVKAKIIPPTSTYKRMQSTVHDTELKRLRTTPYKPTAYGIIRKYK